MLLSLDFANNTIWSCFFFFFLLIDLYFLVPTPIAQIFNLYVELIFPLGIPSKEAKSEIEIYPVIVKAEKENVQYNLELYKPFCALYSSIRFALFLQENDALLLN